MPKCGLETCFGLSPTTETTSPDRADPRNYCRFPYSILACRKMGISGAVIGSATQPQIVDLCSGGGGPISALQRSLKREGAATHLTLTDMYPSVNGFSRLRSSRVEDIHYAPDSIDACDVPNRFKGIRTIFNAFHHFTPAAGRSVLESAYKEKVPIGIFEIPDRRLATIIPMLLTPLLVLLATPFISPFSWKRLFWTYLVPIVPLAWHGTVSFLSGELTIPAK
jgi:hypothetical protein